MFDSYVKSRLSVYGEAILATKEFHEALRQVHHKRCSVGKHSLRVAQTSLRLQYALGKAGVRTDERAIVVGALCHDLGILGRNEKFRGARECCRRHPIDSVDIARRLVPDLDEKTEKIIRRHMFPMTLQPPASIEGVIVTIADKYVAVKDLIAG